MHVETLDDSSRLSGIRKQIRSAFNQAGVPPAMAFDCLVAVTEACTNALLHGTGHPGSPPPQIGWTIDPRGARFEIEDFSNHAGIENEEHGLGHPRDGGYGLPLMRRLMDHVDILFSPSGTKVLLEKKFL